MLWWHRRVVVPHDCYAAPLSSHLNMYTVEAFTEEEASILSRYFTNLDQPVFALINLPEVVKGALFARYSRSPLSLRRLFLDEFVDDPDISGVVNTDAGAGLRRSEALYDRIFFEYGDDSVAQLGGVHLACEQSSNLLTKVLEWGRLMSYLEQSTRYVVYKKPCDGGCYPYFRDPEVLASSFGARYVRDLDSMFDAYIELTKQMQSFFREKMPKAPDDSDFAYRKAINARALDATRGMLPAATLSNVGVYGSGQAYEALLMRMRTHELYEVQAYSQMMLAELRKVIPSFLKRVDLPDRGQITTRYWATNRVAMDNLAHKLFSSPDSLGKSNATYSDDCIEGSTNCGMETDGRAVSTDDFTVELMDFDPDGEEKMIAAMLYPHTSLPECTVLDCVRSMSQEQRFEVVKAYCGTRTNRRHRPGRALERTSYRFDVLSDYGVFRDLQRHRMLTIEWQPLSTRHGYVIPNEVIECGAEHIFDNVMTRSAELYETLLPKFSQQAVYVLPLAYRIRYSMQFNAREAMHMLELRTGPQGHPVYRQICQQMHRIIADQAKHNMVAAMMNFVDHRDDPVLGRLGTRN